MPGRYADGVLPGDPQNRCLPAYGLIVALSAAKMHQVKLDLEGFERHVSRHIPNALDGVNNVGEVGGTCMLGHQNTGTAEASMRSRRTLWMLSRVLTSV
jgi:hypothetical protein